MNVYFGSKILRRIGQCFFACTPLINTNEIHAYGHRSQDSAEKSDKIAVTHFYAHSSSFHRLVESNFEVWHFPTLKIDQLTNTVEKIDSTYLQPGIGLEFRCGTDGCLSQEVTYVEESREITHQVLKSPKADGTIQDDFVFTERKNFEIDYCQAQEILNFKLKMQKDEQEFNKKKQEIFDIKMYFPDSKNNAGTYGWKFPHD